MLRLKRVVLENFISHRKSEVSFTDGVTAITGENGAGKSSIVDAIYFALKVGARPRGSSLDDLVNVRHRAHGMGVILELEDEHRIIQVRVKKPFGRTATYSLRVLDKLKNKVIDTANSQVGVRFRLEHYLGVSVDTVVRTSIIRQGELTRLLMEQPRDRLEIIDKILGLDTYQKAYEKFNDLVQVWTASGVPYRVTERRAIAREVERVKARIKELEEKVRARRKEIGQKVVEKKQMEARLRKLRSELDAIKEEVEALRKKAEEAAAIRKQIEDRETKLRAIVAELQNIRKQKENTEKRLSELAEYERLADALPILSEASSLVKELRDLEKELNKLSERLRSVETLWSMIKELASELSIGLDEVDAELRAAEDRLQEMIERRQGVAASLENSRKRRKELEEELADIIHTVRKAIESASSVLGTEFRSVAEAYDTVSKRLVELEAEIEEISKALRRVAEERATLSAKAEEVKRKISLLKPGVMRCPLCGHDLSKERADELRRSYARELENILNVVTKLSEAEADLEKRMAYVKREKEVLLKLERMLAEARPLEERASEIKATIARLLDEEVAAGSALSELSNRIMVLREKVEKLSKLSKTLERLHGLLGKHPSELAIKEIWDEAERIKRELEERKESLANAIARISKILGKEVSEDDVIELYSKAVAPDTREAVQRIRKLKERLSALKEQENRLVNEAGMIESELQGLRDRLESLRAFLKDLEVKEGLMKEKEGEVLEEEKALSAVEAEIRGMEEEVAEKEREIEGLSTQAEELSKVAKKLAVLAWIKENILHRERAPALIRERAREAVESLLTDYLARLGIEFDSVKVGRDFSITLIRGGIEAPFTSLSGGEKVALSIALLLALRAAVLGRAAGFLILDEPTIHLDSERRELFVELLREFRGGRIVKQLLVVTHDERVEDAADLVIRVIKRPGSDSEIRYVGVEDTIAQTP